MKYFEFVESPVTHEFFICPVHNNCKLTGTSGSYGILAARLLGLNYADYLRLCRDEFGAKIVGKQSMYPVAYFKKSTETEALLKLLNARMRYVMWNREHPNYEEHKKVVEEYEQTRKFEPNEM